ncbi:MAG: aminoacyl-tRNA deacylase [Anaerolineales bacterium]
MKANNVIRLLEQRGIKFEQYHLSAEKRGAVETAVLLGVAPADVYKTIVVTRLERGKNILAIVPGDREVDLKALASALNEKKLHIPTEKDAERITGLQAGGISPLALLNRGFQMVIDSSAQNHATIIISGGQRGLMIRIAPQDLVSITNARFAPITRKDYFVS